jgi:divalent metal cation (Fe/Co/Zn/Cd) transporter
MSLSKIAIVLAAATIAWNVVEAGVAVVSGIIAGSTALIGFGFDSVIEVAAATVVLWRFGGSHDEEEGAERRAVRLIGVTFLALAAYMVIGSARGLVFGDEAEESIVGLVLAATSLVVMPALGLAKLAVAERLGSRSLRAESKETFICAYLSFTLLAGLSLNAAFGWWWADALAALAMSPFIVKEGLEALRGEETEHEAERSVELKTER